MHRAQAGISDGSTQGNEHVPVINLGGRIQVKHLDFQPLFLDLSGIIGGTKLVSEQTRNKFGVQQSHLGEGRTVSGRSRHVAFTTRSETTENNNSEDPNARFASYDPDMLPTLTKYLQENNKNINSYTQIVSPDTIENQNSNHVQNIPLSDLSTRSNNEESMAPAIKRKICSRIW